MKKTIGILGALLLTAAAAGAESVSVKLGYYVPRAQSDLWEQNFENLTADRSDFRGFTLTVEADHFVGDHLNIGGGTGVYEKRVITRDREFEFTDGGTIRQELKLTVIPVEGYLKVFPAGRELPVIPYFGGGAGIYLWRYEESGDFVIYRSTDPRLISGTYFTETISPAVHIRTGVSIPVGRNTIDAEFKYVWAEGNLSSDFDPDFEPFDLGGMQVSAGFSFWF